MNWKTTLFALLVSFFGDKKTFTLQEVYQTCSGGMSYYYPKNNTVEASVRRTLEDLRDMGLITFVDNEGTYAWEV